MPRTKEAIKKYFWNFTELIFLKSTDHIGLPDDYLVFGGLTLFVLCFHSQAFLEMKGTSTIEYFKKSNKLLHARVLSKSNLIFNYYFGALTVLFVGRFIW